MLPLGRVLIASQPIVNGAKSQAIGAEILVRFLLPNGAVVPPNLNALQGNWSKVDIEVARVLHGSLLNGALATLREEGGFISVNVSQETLRDEVAMNELAPLYKGISDCLAGNLVAEISESSEDSDIERRWPLLASVADVIAMDDLGKQKSTVERLHRFDWGLCKLDSPQVVSDACLMMDVLGHCDCIVEGIESVSEMLMCLDQGVIQQQGYYHGRPELIAESLAIKARDMEAAL